MKKIVAAFCLFLIFQLPATAAGGWRNTSPGPGTGLPIGTYWATTSAACAAVLATYSPGNYVEFIGNALAGYCRINGSYVAMQMVYDAAWIPPPVCTPGKESSVTVSQGFKVPGTNTTSDMKAPTNIGGCRVYAGDLVECKSAPTGEVFCTWRVTEGGIAPAGETPKAPATMPADAKPAPVPEHNPALGQGCPKGTVSLGIDSTGQSICGGSGTSPTDPTKTEVKQPTTTTTNADGSTTKVDVTTRTNTDGSTTTTTKTTTTGTDGKVTTTEGSVTGNKPGTGTPGKGTEDSKDEDKNDLCKQHPELNICKNSEVSAGACSGGTDSTSCTGDAIQCAILREQKKQWCELNKENPSATLGNQAVAGNDPIKSTLPTKENAATINMQSLDQSGFLGGGACFQNKTVSMMGRSVVLPFSNVCPYLEWLRYVVMLIAALVSFRIISKPVLGD